MYDKLQERRMKHGNILRFYMTTIQELDQWSAFMAAMLKNKNI